MVQPELHSEDERPQGNGDPGQPVADEAAAGVPQPLGPGGSVEDPIRQDLDVLAAHPPVEPPAPQADQDQPPAPQGDQPPTPAAEAEPERTRGPRYEAFLVRAGEELVAWLKTFASAAVYATLIVTFGFQVARVEGKSMQPTLEDQDRLIVNKAIYKFFDDPQPGDIVMHYYPVDPDKSFVKRIIAEAGDTVRIEDGQVYVNEVLFPVAIPPEFRSREDYGPEVVQDAYYFVMGDHRRSSSDSRTWGQVPKKYIVGKVQLRWWPLSDATLF